MASNPNLQGTFGVLRGSFRMGIGWLTTFMRFMVAHTLGTLAALIIFMVPMFAPYAPVATYIRWQPLLPAMLPFMLGLGIAIWVMTAPLTSIINYLLRCVRLVTQQDYLLTGFGVGLVLSIPFIKVMGMNVVDAAATPVITPAWLVLNQLLYVGAWALSGMAYGAAYYYFHSERIR